ncbi:hypothetical protein ACUHMQ_07470 [Chitinimonas sp. PSY-7]
MSAYFEFDSAQARDRADHISRYDDMLEAAILLTIALVLLIGFLFH